MPFTAHAIRHPLRSYFVLAFAFSWACWSVPALGYRDGAGLAFLVLGGFGPLVAAVTMTRILGGSVKSWFKGLFHWRVAPRWYLFAIGVPVVLAVLVTAEFAMFGTALDSFRRVGVGAGTSREPASEGARRGLAPARGRAVASAQGRP